MIEKCFRLGRRNKVHSIMMHLPCLDDYKRNLPLSFIFDFGKFKTKYDFPIEHFDVYCNFMCSRSTESFEKYMSKFADYVVPKEFCFSIKKIYSNNIDIDLFFNIEQVANKHWNCKEIKGFLSEQILIIKENLIEEIKINSVGDVKYFFHKQILGQIYDFLGLIRMIVYNKTGESRSLDLSLLFDDIITRLFSKEKIQKFCNDINYLLWLLSKIIFILKSRNINFSSKNNSHITLEELRDIFSKKDAIVDFLNIIELRKKIYRKLLKFLKVYGERLDG